MKKIIIGVIIFLIFGSFIYVGYYLYKKNKQGPEVYKTTSPYYTDIIKKTVANGAINPRKEVELKPQISGIIDKIFIEAGDQVKKGQVIAKITVIPDDVTLSNAESALNRAKIGLKEAKIEKERRELLFNEGVISETEYNQYLFEFQRWQQEVEAAENNLQLIKEGVSSKQKETTTIVKSTITGMVLDVPVKEGEQVIESNNFNNGTTIASVADMTDLVFEGMVDESEVGKLKEGMDLNIKVGAIEGRTFDAKLEYISPKGIDDAGTIQFEIKAALEVPEGVMIRAGYSANADIILDTRDSVLAIRERDLIFEDGQTLVELETGEQQFEKKAIKTGLSDGINIQVVEGLSEEDKIKMLGPGGKETKDNLQAEAKEPPKKKEPDKSTDKELADESKDKAVSNPDTTATEPARAGQDSIPIYHTVTANNTLYNIAVTYGVKVKDIQAWNDMKSNTVIVGQKLIVGYKKSN